MKQKMQQLDDGQFFLVVALFATILATALILIAVN